MTVRLTLTSVCQSASVRGRCGQHKQVYDIRMDRQTLHIGSMLCRHRNRRYLCSTRRERMRAWLRRLVRRGCSTPSITKRFIGVATYKPVQYWRAHSGS